MAMNDYDGLIQSAALRYNLDSGIFRRQLVRESGLNPGIVNKTSGAAGIAQFMPATARGLGIDPMDPRQAIPAAAAYMRQHLNNFGGDYAHALAAYNWGPGNVASKGLGAAPEETRNYVNAILGPGASDQDSGDGSTSASGEPIMSASAQPPAPPVQTAQTPPPPREGQGSGLANMFMRAAQTGGGAPPPGSPMNMPGITAPNATPGGAGLSNMFAQAAQQAMAQMHG